MPGEGARPEALPEASPRLPKASRKPPPKLPKASPEPPPKLPGPRNLSVIAGPPGGTRTAHCPAAPLRIVTESTGWIPLKE